MEHHQDSSGAAEHPVERLVVWHRWIVPARPEAPDAEAHARWLEALATRMRTAGGHLLARIGGTLVATFHPADLEEALQVLLSAAAEAEVQLGEGAAPFVSGVALGELRQVSAASSADLSVWRGEALDRAQALAGRGRAGEVVLDALAADRASQAFLFGRTVSAGAVRGLVVDPERPLRRTCRMAIGKLARAPLSPSARAAFEEAAEALDEGGPRRLVLRGPVAAGGAAWVEALVRRFAPSLCLHAGRVAGGLQPLGGLQVALRRFGLAAPHATLRPAGAAGEVLRKIRDGETVPRTEAISGLRSFLEQSLAAGGRPWIVIDGGTDVDPASLEVLVQAADGLPVAVIALLASDAPLPTVLTRSGPCAEAWLPTLSAADGRALAEAMLGVPADSDIARRVALLGGDRRLGVEEAARTLVASGDLVHDGARFVWRRRPRGGTRAVPVESLLGERLAGLDTVSHRLLQAVCIAADADGELAADIAAADGLDASRRAGSIERLREEHLLAPGAALEPASPLVRLVVRSSMPPARAAELHRFASQALAARAAVKAGGFLRAQLAYHLAEGGMERKAAAALLEVAEQTRDAEFPHAALRLAAAAVQVDPSGDTRQAASQLARSIGPRPARPSSTAPASRPPAPDALRRAVEAILEQDVEAADRHIDLLLAAGRARGAAERLRALVHVSRGDVAGAMRIVRRAQAAAAPRSPDAARAALALSVVLLHVGQIREGIRAALEALAIVRTLADPKGERAAMHLLARCYRALSRNQQAMRIEHAAPPS